MSLLGDVEKYVKNLFTEQDDKIFIYHNIDHTRDVVEAADLLAEKSGLNKEETELVKIAAWFHDIGYPVDYENHEDKSKDIASIFLTSKGVSEEKISIITSCIEATRIPQNPKNILEKVLCDADMYHLSQDDFCEKSVLLRLEQNNLRGTKTGKTAFMRESMRFLEKPYFTDYASENLMPGKKYNQQTITQKIKGHKTKKKLKAKSTSENIAIEDLKKRNEQLKNKLRGRQLPFRGVESMFRLTARNQINLSSIADNKSNILITVNSLIISVVITLLARKYYELPHLIIPASIFLLTCLITMIFAILSTRPNISKGRFTEEDIKKKNVNLLFFGNFYNMELEQYEWAVMEMMKDDKHLYGVMIKDQYYLGKVLAKKYKLLRTAYTIFMFGFIFTIIAFAVAMISFAG